MLILIGFGGANFKFSNLANHSFSQDHDFEIEDEVLNGDIELGKRIFHVRNGCVDCHGTDLAGVQVINDPAMGDIWGANITPYKLKDWSNKEVAQAIRYGIRKNGKSLKFMPAFEYVNLSKSDIGSIIKYIRSVEPVEKESHVNSFGPVAKVLSSLGKMPVMFPAHLIDHNQGFAQKPIEAPTVAFGKYLAFSCTGCHGANYEGGPIPGGDPSWPEASNIRFGQNDLWNEESFYKLLETGVSPISGNAIRFPMPIESLKKLNEVEKKALWLYLSELK